jgi:hypothetical protein
MSSRPPFVGSSSNSTELIVVEAVVFVVVAVMGVVVMVLVRSFDVVTAPHVLHNTGHNERNKSAISKSLAEHIIVSSHEL